MSATRVPGLLEREDEVDTLEAAVSSVFDRGVGDFLWIEGPAGIGKTRLLQAARVVAEAQGIRVLRGSGGRLERELPLELFRQLLTPLVLRDGEEDRQGIFSGPAQLAEHLATGALTDTSRPTGTLNPVFHAVWWSLARLAQAQPVLVVADDVQWIDRDSLELLAFIARRTEEAPILVVAAVRGDEPVPTADLLDELRALARRHLKPRPLSERAVREMVGDAFGPAEAHFVSACFHATGGSPFYLHELVRELALREVPPTAAAAERVSRMSPEAISRSVLLRLAALPPPAAELARAVSVVGDGRPLMVSGRLAGLGDADMTQGADALLATGILGQADPATYCHPIVQRAVYGDIPEMRRAVLHEEAATILHETGADVSTVAGHLVRAPRLGSRRTVERLLAGAEEALAKGSPAAACTYLERALAEPPDDHSREAVATLLARAALRVGRFELAEPARAMLRDPCDPVARARLALSVAPSVAVMQKPLEAIAMLEDAASALGSQDRDVTLQLEAAIASVGRLHPTTAEGVDKRLARFVTLRGESRSERLLLANVARSLLVTEGRAEPALAAATRALAGGLLLAEQGPEAPAFHLAAQTLVSVDEYDLAIEHLDRAVEEARENASVLGFALSTMGRGRALFRAGRLQEAEADFRTCGEALARVGQPLALPTAIGGIVDVLIERDALDEAEGLLSDLGLAGDVPEHWFFQSILAARGRLRTAQARHGEAVRDQFERARRDAALGHVDAAGWTHRTDVAPSLAALGRVEEAIALIEEEIASARRLGTRYALGMALRQRGLLLGPEGIADLAEAVAVLEPSPARLELAKSQLELGAALRRSGRRADARLLLERALDGAHRAGARRHAERARVELQATGARPRRHVYSGREALTPSELRIVKMAARGCSNREIAEALFVTKKTVESHLRNSYTKLGIDSRKDLAAALEEAAPRSHAR